MSFETIAEETVAKFTAVSNQLEQTQSNLDLVQTEVDTLSQRLEQDYAQLTEKAQGLLEQMNQSREEIAETAEEAQSTLSALKEKLETIQEQINESFSETKEAIAHLDEQIETHQSDLDENLQTTNEAFHTLKDTAETIKAELSDLFNQMKDYLSNEVNQDLQTHREDVDEQASTFEQYLNEECQPAMTDKITEFREHLNELIQNMDDHLKKMESETEETSQRSIDDVSEAQLESFRSLLETANRIEDLMSRLGDAIESAGQLFTAARKSMKTTVKTTNVGATIAIGLFQDALEIFDIG